MRTPLRRPRLLVPRIETLVDAANLWRLVAQSAGTLHEELGLAGYRVGHTRSAIVALQWVYSAGACGDFAAALHALTGWPTKHLVDWKGPVHAMCETPDGRLVDVHGYGTAAAVQLREGYRTVKLAPAPALDRLVGRVPRAKCRLWALGIDPLALAQRVAVLLPYAPFTTLDPDRASPVVAR